MTPEEFARITIAPTLREVLLNNKDKCLSELPRIPRALIGPLWGPLVKILVPLVARLAVEAFVGSQLGRTVADVIDIFLSKAFASKLSPEFSAMLTQALSLFDTPTNKFMPELQGTPGLVKSSGRFVQDNREVGFA